MRDTAWPPSWGLGKSKHSRLFRLGPEEGHSFSRAIASHKFLRFLLISSYALGRTLRVTTLRSSHASVSVFEDENPVVSVHHNITLEIDLIDVGGTIDQLHLIGTG